MNVVLDAEAINALIQERHPARLAVRRAMTAAERLGRDVVVPTVTLAELYRGAGRNRALDAMLARESAALLLRDTDRGLARLVGAILAEARVGSEYLADAHAVAAAVEVGGGVVLTGDPDDLSRLAAPYRTVVIEKLDSK
ncbi:MULTISPECIES: PIN domain-containing protein [Pseudofrankia]|uniref:PIN domain-containing protein n=1 Tax=Pseudofrankia TaxID=2994363 RepID=UPI000234D3CC|nr:MULTISPECIES: PIN domain-containing protein [Pseudofrankia]OHV41748.1 DNA-binding protein [Pseudofrankia sp. EUN1h]